MCVCPCLALQLNSRSPCAGGKLSTPDTPLSMNGCTHTYMYIHAYTHIHMHTMQVHLLYVLSYCPALSETHNCPVTFGRHCKDLLYVSYRVYRMCIHCVHTYACISINMYVRISLYVCKCVSMYVRTYTRCVRICMYIEVRTYVHPCCVFSKLINNNRTIIKKILNFELISCN